MEKLDCEIIKEYFRNEDFIISHHARSRMFQRNVSTDDLKKIVQNSEIIESYPDDVPCPSVLLLGTVNDETYHVVWHSVMTMQEL
jgi:hypothetical protein